MTILRARCDNGATFAGAAPAGYAGGAAYCPPQPAYGPASGPRARAGGRSTGCASARGCSSRRAGSILPDGIPSVGDRRTGQCAAGCRPSQRVLWSVRLRLRRRRVDPNAIFDTDFDPSNGFFQFDPDAGLFGFAYVPRLEEIQLRDNSGLPLTLGIPTYSLRNDRTERLDVGTGERSLPILQPGVHPGVGAGFGGIRFNPATTMKVDGVAGLSSCNYSEFLDIEYRSDLWGADTKYVVDSLSPPGEGLKFKPLFRREVRRAAGKHVSEGALPADVR